MNQSMDRELGQFQQKLENTSDNVDIMRKDLNRLFENIDNESKSHLKEVARVEGKIDIHLQTDEQDKSGIKLRVEENKLAIDNNEKNIAEEQKARTILETQTKTSLRIAQAIAGVLGLIATVISVITAIYK